MKQTYGNAAFLDLKVRHGASRPGMGKVTPLVQQTYGKSRANLRPDMGFKIKLHNSTQEHQLAHSRILPTADLRHCVFLEQCSKRYCILWGVMQSHSWLVSCLATGRGPLSLIFLNRVLLLNCLRTDRYFQTIMNMDHFSCKNMGRFSQMSRIHDFRNSLYIERDAKPRGLHLHIAQGVHLHRQN